MTYLNDYQGDSTFAKLLHKHAVENTACRSVRNRIGIISQMVNNFRNSSRWQDSDKIDVLSVGSGAAFELKNIFKSPKNCGQYKFVLFDQDPIALAEAADLVNEIERMIDAKPEVNTIQGSVRTMLFSRKFREQRGKFDFIYALGLFDYLNLRVAEAVINRLYQLLEPGGELVIGNFNVSNPSRYYMEYWGDWVLLYRTEEELKNLFQRTSKANVRVLYDDTGSQMFLDIKKMKAAM
jgi:extracellular factor (EF) 3-hydroxypalmitic acid methyl ester biosynthesis protein